jgi:2-oxoglutarate dehydrogenase E2 component (dihydrolipoamide succinyltransferase)
VRSIAKAEGVNLAEVQGSGIHGRVTKKDILAYLERRKAGEVAAPAAAPAAAARPAAAGFSVPAYTAGERVTIEPMSKIRQITAAHMAYSKATSAHVTTVFHIDMSRIHRAREGAKAGFAKANGTKLTYMPFIFKAVAAALRQHKKVNAAIDGTNIVYKHDINLGMAVALDWGLIVPVIKQADTLSLVGLAKAANDLAERARSKKLKPEEVQGGTFTITNPGVFGSLFGTPVINQPQVAILGVGAIEKRPVVASDADGNDVIAIKAMAYFAITYDHRLVDGADADHFMNDVKTVLEGESWAELELYR